MQKKMESFAKLIYRSNISYFPSKLPVQFYGLPDGKVYVVFARFYEVKYDRTYLEFVFAEHKEFSYDFEKEKLIPHGNYSANLPVYNEIVDKPEPKVEIIKTFRNINSFAEAFDQLNKKARSIARNLNMKDNVQELPGNNKMTAIA
jgi:hypothetical protein